MYNPFASFAGAFVVYTILFFQNTEVILYGSMPYTKHIFNILRVIRGLFLIIAIIISSRSCGDNFLGPILGPIFLLLGSLLGPIFLLLGSLLGHFLGTLPSILLMGSTKATSSTSKLFSNIGLLQPTSFLLQVLLNTLIDYRMVLPVVLAKAG